MVTLEATGPLLESGDIQSPETLRRMSQQMWRFRVAAVCVVLTTLAFLQDPGMTAADTKLDLNQSPWQFLARALNLWDERGFFGQVQNQAYGYLWPMGPFFGVGDSLGLSPWIVQRLWWALILCVAFLGMVRLTRLLGISNPWARLISALAFALAPRIMTTLGPTSIEAWPMALAPWLLIPLVRGSVAGSPRRWAALSGVAFLCIGGVNAVATMAILPLGALWLLTLEPGPRRRALAGWWVLAIGLASVWWLIPLALLSRYSPPFLDWIESAAITTGQADPTSALRGTSDWVAYLVGPQGPLWQAGWSLLAQPWLVLGTGVIAAVGLAGLAVPTIRHRGFLLLCLFTGMTLVTLGHIGTTQGLGASVIQPLLDGALAPLRNTHKFAPLIAVPLAIGLAWSVQKLLAWKPRSHSVRVLAGVVVAAVVASVVASGWPLLSGQITRGRVFLEIPQYWSEAATWLDSNADEGRALLVPGASFGEYLWGRTQDEPLQVLTSKVGWAVRDAVPLSSAGNIRFLDEVEARLEAGKGSPGLANALNRAGVRWLVIRNDLDPVATNTPPPVLVHQALEQSPGFERVAGFGPLLIPFRGAGVVVNDGIDRAYTPVEIYRVGPADSPPLAARVDSADGLATFTGGPESLVGMADAGLIDQNPGVSRNPLILAGDTSGTWSTPAALPTIVTDSYRRSEVSFGSMRDQYSATYSADQPWALSRKVHDYNLRGDVQQSVARYLAIASVTASSSGADPTALMNRSPASQPWSALDGDVGTAWRPGALRETPWWQVDFASPRQLTRVSLRVHSNTGSGGRILVTTEGGTQEFELPGGVGGDVITLNGATTNFLRIEATSPGPSFAISEVVVPDLGATRPIVTPTASGEGGVLLEARRGQRSGCGASVDVVTCATWLAKPGEEQAGIDRVVELTKGGSYDIRMSVRPRPGAALDALLATGEGGTSATASSVSTSDPAGRAAAAYDGDPATTWMASSIDTSPRLTLDLGEPRAVSGLRLSLSPFASASSPLRVEVSTDEWTRELYVNSAGEVRWKPTLTQLLSVRFVVNNPVRSVVQGGAGSKLLPVGVSELEVLGAGTVPAGLAGLAPVSSPCGFGPQVSIDGTTTASTSVSSTAAAVTRGSLAVATSCDGSLSLEPGEHRITVPSSSEWVVDSLALVPTSTKAVAGASRELAITESEGVRHIQAGASDQVRVLSLGENFNDGLRATTNGEELPSVRVDGWQQAFVLPEGTSGDIEIRYAPNTMYRSGLLVGLLAVAVLALLAGLRGRRDYESAHSRPLTALVLIAAAVCVLLATGPVGLVMAGFGYLAARRMRTPWLVVMIGAMVGAVAQAVIVWPQRASAGEVVGLLLTLPIAVALGALAAAAHRDAPETGDSATGTDVQPRTN